VATTFTSDDNFEPMEFMPSRKNHRQALQFVCPRCECEISIGIIKSMTIQKVNCPICDMEVLAFEQPKTFELI